MIKRIPGARWFLCAVKIEQGGVGMMQRPSDENAIRADMDQINAVSGDSSADISTLNAIDYIDTLLSRPQWVIRDPMSSFRVKNVVLGLKNSPKMTRFLAKNGLFLPCFDLFLSRDSVN